MDKSFPREIIDGARVHVFRRVSTAAKTEAAFENNVLNAKAAPADTTEAFVPRLTSAGRHVIGRNSSMLKQLVASPPMPSTSGVLHKEGQGPASEVGHRAMAYLIYSTSYTNPPYL